MLINPSCICSRICSAHVSSSLLQFSVIFHLRLFVSTTSQTKRAYSCVRTNNCKQQAQNEQCHDQHTTTKEIKRNLPITHFENTNTRSNQKLYTLKMFESFRSISQYPNDCFNIRDRCVLFCLVRWFELSSCKARQKSI